MTDPLEGLRKVLALEGSKRYSNTAVVGGLDAYLQHLVTDNQLPLSHPIVQVLGQLPDGGYRILHPIQRKTVIEGLLRAASQASQSAVVKPKPRAPANARSRMAMPVSRRASTAPPPPGLRPPVTSAAPKPRSPRPSAVVGTPDSAVSVLSGISRAVEGRLSKLEIRTVRDLLYHIPVRYHDYSEVRPIAELQIDEEQTVIGEVWSVSATTIGRRKATEAIVGDRSGTIRVIWWSGHWMARRLRQGMKVALSGRSRPTAVACRWRDPSWNR